VSLLHSYWYQQKTLFLSFALSRYIGKAIGHKLEKDFAPWLVGWILDPNQSLWEIKGVELIRDLEKIGFIIPNSYLTGSLGRVKRTEKEDLEKRVLEEIEEITGERMRVKKLISIYHPNKRLKNICEKIGKQYGDETKARLVYSNVYDLSKLIPIGNGKKAVLLVPKEKGYFCKIVGIDNVLDFEEDVYIPTQSQ